MKKSLRPALMGISIILLFQGCSAILGIRTPSQITRPQAIRYLQKHDMDTSKVIYLKPAYFDSLRARPFKPGWEPGFRPIQCKLFAPDGKLIFHYASCEGPLKNTGIYENFPPNNLSQIDSTYTLTNEMQMASNPLSAYDEGAYIAIIYWATYTGIPGRRFVKKVEKALNEKKVDISIFRMNTDIMERE